MRYSGRVPMARMPKKSRQTKACLKSPAVTQSDSRGPMAKVLVAASQPRPHREDLFRTPKWVLLAATAIVAVVILFYLHAALALWPSPSDDLFYIDAAWNLQNGTYRPPWAGAPYHHYLRWPVVLPLAALIRLFGVSQKSIAVFSILPHLGCALLLFLIFRDRK